jgi:hypothetical protein
VQRPRQARAAGTQSCSPPASGTRGSAAASTRYWVDNRPAHETLSSHLKIGTVGIITEPDADSGQAIDPTRLQSATAARMNMAENRDVPTTVAPADW